MCELIDGVLIPWGLALLVIWGVAMIATHFALALEGL